MSVSPFKLHDTLADKDCKIEKIVKLLKENVDIEICNEKGQRPIHIAVSNPHCNYEVIALLISKGASVNSLNVDEETPLHIAVKQPICRLDIVKMLLSRHCDVNAQDSNCNTPLHNAVRTLDYNLSVIKILMDYKADLMVSNEEGLIPLYVAFDNPNCSVHLVKILMRGFNERIFNYSRFTPLQTYVHRAIFRIEIFEELVNEGGNLWRKSEFTERNILHHAVTANNSYVVLAGVIKVILKYKRNYKISDMINEIDINLDSPLNLALKVNDIDVNVISLLLKHGANPNNPISIIKPLNLAIRACHAKAVELLLEYNASMNDCRFFQPSPFRDIITRFVFDKKKYKSCFLTVLKYYSKIAFEKDECALKSCKDFLCTELDIKDIVNVRNFLEDCCQELHQMKKERLTMHLSLYDVVLNSRHRAKEYIPKDILSVSNCRNYYIYHNNIANYFEKSQLLSELQNQHVYCKNNDIRISLVPDCTLNIGYYLSNEDLLSFVLAFYKPVVVQNIKAKSLKRLNLENITYCKRKRCKIDMKII